MATGIPPKSKIKHKKIPVQVMYEGKEDALTILSKPFGNYNEQLAINGGGNNKFFFGDNLDALLYMLDNGYRGKIKLVYIDPPFATTSTFVNRDQEHAYTDSLSGGEFVEFLRQRLILIRELLADDGSIYLHLDNKMAFTMKLIMDEVFGEANCRAFITRKKCSTKNYTKNTYGNNKFGANIYGYNTNIANASPFNMLSGYEKEVGKFIATITSDNPKDSNRNLIPAQICAILNITSDEYAQLYKEIQKIKYNTQLDNIDKIQIGERIFTGKQIKNAILEANEIIINKKKVNKHNEVNIYIPKTDSIIAKVDSVGEIPQQLLNIASNLDLPILILGNA